MTNIKTFQRLVVTFIIGLSLVSCGGGDSDSKTSSEDLPIAIDDTAAAVQNGPTISILPLINDTSTLTLDETTIEIITDPQNGNANVINTGEIEYTPNPDYIGTDSLVYTVKDTVGNFSNPATVEIVISEAPDITAPVITIIGDSHLSIAKPGPYIDQSATAEDDRDGPVEVTITSNVDVNTLGEYSVNYTAKDTAGNTASASRIVEITAQFLKENTRIKDNCVKFLEEEGFDLNDDGKLDTTNDEITKSEIIFTNGIPISRADLSTMIINRENVSNINTCEIKDMSSLFDSNNTFNQDISQWNVGAVTNMSYMFGGAYEFNQDISDWNVSNVSDMSLMFQNARAFDGDISNWKTGNVKNMKGMFFGASSFNQNINEWDVSNLESTIQMFRDASKFNRDISSWNVSNVLDMQEMFFNAASFNQNLNSWDVSNVIDMSRMFLGASSFNQSISKWNVGKVEDMSSMFIGVTLTPEIYDSILIAWDKASKAAGNWFSPRTFNVGLNIPSITGANARKNLLERESWNIIDGDSPR